MTPLMKWLKKQWEKHLGTFDEGPEPPARIGNVVGLFARTYPKATVADWVAFATAHAEGAYKDGYVRGYERSERLGPDWEDPDEAAKLLEHQEQVELGNESAFDADSIVPVEGSSKEFAVRTYMEQMYEYEAQQGPRRGPHR